MSGSKNPSAAGTISDPSLNVSPLLMKEMVQEIIIDLIVHF
jgi:hypothetical protein